MLSHMKRLQEHEAEFSVCLGQSSSACRGKRLKRLTRATGFDCNMDTFDEPAQIGIRNTSNTGSSQECCPPILHSGLFSCNPPGRGGTTLPGSHAGHPFRWLMSRRKISVHVRMIRYYEESLEEGILLRVG